MAYTKPVVVSTQLAEFLYLAKDEKVSRAEINRAICQYIKPFKNETKDNDDEEDVARNASCRKWADLLNPNGERNLQDPKNPAIIIPDQLLSDLLAYPEYQANVAAGLHFWHRKKPWTHEKIDVQETDSKLTYSVLQYLISFHILGSEIDEEETKQLAQRRTTFAN